MSKANCRAIFSAISWEGNPCREYHWPKFILAVIPAIAWGLILFLWRQSVRKKIPDTRDVPKNAIVYLFHGELFNQMLLMEFFAQFSRSGGWVLGIHSFVSYLWSGESFIRHWKCFRYLRRERMTYKDVILEFLRRADVATFRLATDSGGPYGTVRASLVDMSLGTNRPLVAVRAIASMGITIKSHVIPIPFCRVKARFSKPITPEELRPLSRDQGRELLQKTIDLLGK